MNESKGICCLARDVTIGELDSVVFSRPRAAGTAGFSRSLPLQLAHSRALLDALRFRFDSVVMLMASIPLTFEFLMSNSGYTMAGM
ncbi:hypothetical protein BDB13_6376 [Rhodococcus sp. OK302]|nr:hypothetical protein BDB13_6376 [Rhodococcus sp. OK302]